MASIQRPANLESPKGGDPGIDEKKSKWMGQIVN